MFFDPWVPVNFDASGRTLILMDKCRRGPFPSTSSLSGWGQPFDQNWHSGFVTCWITRKRREDAALQALYHAFKDDAETEDGFWKRLGFSFLLPGVIAKRNGSFRMTKQDRESGLHEFDEIIDTVKPNKILIAGNDFVEDLFSRSHGGREGAKTRVAQVWRLSLPVRNRDISAVGVYNPTAWLQMGFGEDEQAFAKQLLATL